MEVQQTYGDRVTFIGVPGLAATDKMADFIERTGTDGILHVPDSESGLWERFGVNQQRTYVLLNDDGTWERTGYGNLESDVQALIDR